MANPLVKVKRRMSNKSLVAIFIAITIAVTLLFSVAVIFAFNQQSISSSVRITYKTVDITGSVTMYAKTGTATEFYKGTDTANKVEEFIFDVETDTSETPAELNMEETELTKTNNTLYLHYVFENAGQRAYTAILSCLETEIYTQNMEIKYSQTGEEGSYITSNYGLVVAGNSTKDYYVTIAVKDLALNAEFDGTFTWQLNECDEDLTQMEEISLTATSFQVVDQAANTYSAQYNGEDISIKGISSQANEGIEHIWYVPARIGTGRVVSVVKSGLDEDGNQINLPQNTKVIIANGVEKIGNDAFYDSGLTEIDIPNSVTSIGFSAFESCSSLTSITIPNSVTSIGTGAFASCTSLTSIKIPNSVTSIGVYTFLKCYKLVEIYNLSGLTLSAGDYEELSDVVIHTNNNEPSVVYMDANGFQYFEYETGKYKILGYVGEDTEITIPSSYNNFEISEIREYAFYNCTSLTSIEIPNTVTSIGDEAFSDCTSLTIITVEKNNPIYHSASNCVIETETKTLIVGCKSSIIPDDGSVTSIGSMAFYRCTGLTSITIPNGVTSIGADAFNYCISLNNVKIGSGVIVIDRWAFYYCTSLNSVTFAKTSGWKRYSSITETSGTTLSSIGLTIPATAATWLKSTYHDFCWKRTV